MTATEELIAALEAGLTVTPEAYAAAKAADELQTLTAAVDERVAADQAAAERVERIAADLAAGWDAIDAETDEVEVEYRKFIAQHEALCKAVDRLKALGQASKSYIGHNHVTPDEMPEQGGRGAFDFDAMGSTKFDVTGIDAGRKTLIWPVSELYFTWVRNRRAEGIAASEMAAQ